jgi:hypothetical protein
MSLRELNTLAATGLAHMWDPEKHLFCFRLKRAPDGIVREGLSCRYTIMAILGLHRLETARRESSPIGIRAVVDDLLDNTDWIDNIGDLGLLVWLCALVAPARLEETYSKLNVKDALARFPKTRKGLTMELAWLLSGLAHAALVERNKLPNLAVQAIKTYGMLTANQGRHGIFGHLARNGSMTGVLRGRVGSFADQVYPIYALSKFAQAYQNQPALEAARICAEAICKAQGSLGQWWWHYDASTGKVFQRYPVYAVHQHGMAPLALFALSEAAGLDFSESIYKGLRWIDGNNELNRNLREPSFQLVWRSVYRRSLGKMYIREFGDFLRNTASAVSADELDITFECRPYELGWLLYAFGGRDHDAVFHWSSPQTLNTIPITRLGDQE